MQHTGAVDQPPAPGAITSDETALRDWVASRDAPCPVCSYNLRGLKLAVCPECAASLHLQVGSTNLRIGAWLTAVMGLALALGFDGVVAVLITAGLILHPPKMRGDFQFMLMLLGAFVVLAAACLAGIALLVRKRSRWNRLTNRTRWIMALGIFGGVGVFHAVFGLYLSAYFR